MLWFRPFPRLRGGRCLGRGFTSRFLSWVLCLVADWWAKMGFFLDPGLLTPWIMFLIALFSLVGAVKEVSLSLLLSYSFLFGLWILVAVFWDYLGLDSLLELRPMIVFLTWYAHEFAYIYMGWDSYLSCSACYMLVVVWLPLSTYISCFSSFEQSFWSFWLSNDEIFKKNKMEVPW